MTVRRVDSRGVNFALATLILVVFATCTPDGEVDL
jgi:hypothetical protein